MWQTARNFYFLPGTLPASGSGSGQQPERCRCHCSGAPLAAAPGTAVSVGSPWAGKVRTKFDSSSHAMLHTSLSFTPNREHTFEVTRIFREVTLKTVWTICVQTHPQSNFTMCTR